MECHLLHSKRPGDLRKHLHIQLTAFDVHMATASYKNHNLISEDELRELGLDGIYDNIIPKDCARLCELVDDLDFILGDATPEQMFEYVQSWMVKAWKDWDGMQVIYLETLVLLVLSSERF